MALVQQARTQASWILGLLTVLAAGIAPAPAAASDDCATATVISPPSSTPIDITPATEAVGDPVHSCTGTADFHTVWFSYTATFTGDLHLSALAVGPSFHVVVSAYSGTCGALTELGCAHHAAGLTALDISVVQGETYLIEVASVSGAGGVVHLAAFPPPSCGDGIPNQASEECDDGNADDTDACTSACLNAECGDGFIQAGVEDCDDANLDEDDGCTSSCETVCGDGITAGVEACDDGNTNDGDGCDSDCRPPCPSTLCKCLGAAGGFALIGGESLQTKNGRFSEAGASEYVPPEVYGSSCAVTAKTSAKEGESYFEGDLIATKPAGKTAVTFGALKIDGLVEPGAYIAGDVATGGGTIKYPQNAVVDGVSSSDGTHPGVAICQQALTDLQAASTLLKNLPPTQTIDEIVVDDGETHVLNVGPGVQVINVNTIKVLSGRDEFGDPAASILEVTMVPATEMVIINVAVELKVETDGFIDVIGGEPDSVVLNLHAAKPKLTLKTGAALYPVLLAPTEPVKLPVYSFVSNVFTAKKAAVAGATIEDILLCDE